MGRVEEWWKNYARNIVAMKLLWVGWLFIQTLTKRLHTYRQNTFQRSIQCLTLGSLYIQWPLWEKQRWELSTLALRDRTRLTRRACSKGSQEKNKYVQRPLLTLRGAPPLSTAHSMRDLRVSGLCHWHWELKWDCPMKTVSMNLRGIQTNSWD